jgi:hypothetical protein
MGRDQADPLARPCRPADAHRSSVRNLSPAAHERDHGPCRLAAVTRGSGRSLDRRLAGRRRARCASRSRVGSGRGSTRRCGPRTRSPASARTAPGPGAQRTRPPHPPGHRRCLGSGRGGRRTSASARTPAGWCRASPRPARDPRRAASSARPARPGRAGSVVIAESSDCGQKRNKRQR